MGICWAKTRIWCLGACCGVDVLENLANPQRGLGGKLVSSLVFDSKNIASIRRSVQCAHQELGSPAEWSLLEIGFGTGTGIELAVQLGAQVTGVEISDEMIRRASERNQAAVGSGQVTLVNHNVDNGMDLWPDNSFDVVMSSNVIYFWKDFREVLRECLRVLKPGGRLVTTFVHKDNMLALTQKEHGPFRNFFSPEDLVGELEQLEMVDADKARVIRVEAGADGFRGSEERYVVIVSKKGQ